ncbi:D-alanyl-lipoteichoic acid biosynthesis protein DltD [uncultured Eubacterium sp.]|uniref:D-alanyl-lipoteichoic acid biosynthesis protein DltD n=1 Tax=Eubacterium sp. TaxID=142586 RepID=UPI002671E28F|nr:D-alanyl-lipoteichoic acid biosynthesis protein DltD [uncultured Eubacterium sp.]
MKNLKAIGMAFVLFLITVSGIKITEKHTTPKNSVTYGTWDSASKFANTEGLKRLVNNKEAMVILGSSELRHCQKTGFHGDTVYQNTDMKPIFIGRGGYQSLNHAITLGAIADGIKNKKVVISVSPQWFKPTGVRKDAFGDSYSESHMIAFLKNKDISKETKKYVISRIKTLTADNHVMWSRIQDDVKWYMDNDGNTFDKVRKNIHSYLVNDKAETKLFMASILRGRLKDKKPGKEKQIQWDKLYKKADLKGKKMAPKNKYGMFDDVYKRKLKYKVDHNMIRKLNYTTKSIEFKDLQCFLDVCREENIKAMIVMLPFNGRWSDYAEYPQKNRNKIYNAVRKIAKDKGAELADLSEMEYENYVFEDDSHLALKGLVNFNEQIYNFYKQN